MSPCLTNPIPRCGYRARLHRQRGAAALIVVMVLFFIISMVAAYTSRNLIFEQRTSANQYRSSQAFEAADAGIEWGLAQLNAGRMGDSCTASVDDASATDLSFRARYLTINGTSGNVTPRTPTGAGSVQPSCVLDASSPVPANWRWACRCPQSNASTAALGAPTTAGPAPAFLLSMSSGARPDLIQLVSASCTRLDPSCLGIDSAGASGDGVAQVSVMVALRSALNRLPAAALTVAGTLTPAGGSAVLSLTNTDVASNGSTLDLGSGSPPIGVQLTGLPGTPPSATLFSNDAALSPAAVTGFSMSDRQFATFFGITPTTYFQQPALVTIDCSAGCTAAQVNLALLRNPGQAIRLSGTGLLTLDAAVGTAALPALLIAEGDVRISDGITFTGLLYGRKSSWNWTVDHVANVQGAVIAEGSLTLSGATSITTITYNAGVLNTLRLSYGSFVRVPGSWKDFAGG
jgi:hypothetical protein